MKEKIKIILVEDQITIRSIDEKDIEYLRVWKNENKEFFFLKSEISKSDQLNWFNSMKSRQDDEMFIVEKFDQPIGCIGARLYEGFVDIYNVIMGDKNFKGQHIMMKVMQQTINHCKAIYPDMAIKVRVLPNNPAVNWYIKIGFTKVSNANDHLLMEYESSK
jgi:RimJ/RimL family protein N-acetyltransferase